MIPDEIVETEDKPATGDTSSDRSRSSSRGRYSRPRRRPRSRTRPPLEAGGPRSPAKETVDTQAAPDSASVPDSKFEEHPAPPPVPKGRAIYAAIEKVEAITLELKQVLDELELVMEYLEDVERQQITDEREIEVLRSRLESLHRRADRAQPQRVPQGRQQHRDRDEASLQNPA